MSKAYKIPVEEKEALLRRNLAQQLRKELPYEKYPRSMVIEVTAACNFRCIHCNHKTMQRKKGNMSMDLYKKIIDELAENAPETEIWPTFYGEAFLLKYKLFYMLDYAKKRGMKNVVINTNGSMLTEEVCDWILEVGLSRLIISVDGFTKETLEKIRVGADRDQIYGGINILLEKKRRMGKRPTDYPVIECQYSMMSENEHEVSPFIDYWTRRGALVLTREKLTWSGAVDAPNLSKDISRITCLWVFHAACHWNGDMVACPCDWSGGFVAGNLKEGSVTEIWQGRHKEFRQIHVGNRWKDLPTLCDRCLDWQTTGGASLHWPLHA